MVNNLMKFVISMFLISLLGTAEAETINVNVDAETTKRSLDAMIGAVRAIAINLSDDSGVMFGMASITWRVVAFILLVWSIINWIWLKKDLIDLVVALFFIFLTGSFIYLDIEGVPAFAYITGSFLEGFSALASLLYFEAIGASGIGKTLWDAAGFMAGLSQKLTFDVDVGWLGKVGAAFAVLIAQIIFLIMAAVAYVVTLTAQFGAGVMVAVGLIFVPLIMLPFGLQMFFVWLKAFLAFLFTMMFVALILALTSLGVLELIGLDSSLIDDGFWDDSTVLVIHADDTQDVLKACLIPFIGFVALLQSFTWGSMLAGAGIPTGGGRNAALATRMIFR